MTEHLHWHSLKPFVYKPFLHFQSSEGWRQGPYTEPLFQASRHFHKCRCLTYLRSIWILKYVGS